MYISPKASRLRQRAAQRARDNRAEIARRSPRARSPSAKAILGE